MTYSKILSPVRETTTLISAWQFLVVERFVSYRFRRRKSPSGPDQLRQTVRGNSSRPLKPEPSSEPDKVHALVHLFPLLSVINFPLWVIAANKDFIPSKITSSILESSSIDKELWLDIDWRDLLLAALKGIVTGSCPVSVIILFFKFWNIFFLLLYDLTDFARNIFCTTSNRRRRLRRNFLSECFWTH